MSEKRKEGATASRTPSVVSHVNLFLNFSCTTAASADRYFVTIFGTIDNKFFQSNCSKAINVLK